MSDPFPWKPWQKMYSEAMERATGGALTAGEAVALNSTGGLMGPDGGLFAQALDVATGWLPGVKAHSVLHDAAGFLANTKVGFGVGPGYLYVGPAGSATYNFFGLSRTLRRPGRWRALPALEATPSPRSSLASSERRPGSWLRRGGQGGAGLQASLPPLQRRPAARTACIEL
jgi:hypothetical protein